MEFVDYPELMNHCHILFHEDAGMMQAVKVILNTDSNYIAVDHAKSDITLRLGSTTDQDFDLKPYGKKARFNVAVGDVNHGKFFDKGSVYGFEYLKDANPNGRNGASDNIADVVTIGKAHRKVVIIRSKFLMEMLSSSFPLETTITHRECRWITLGACRGNKSLAAHT